MAGIIDKSIVFFTEIYSKLIIKVVVAIIIILIGFIIGKIVGRLIYKILSEINVNSLFKRSTGINLKPDIIISNTVTYLIDFFSIIIALDAVALTPGLVYVISGAIIVIIIVSIIIGIKDIIPNAIAGFVMFRKKQFKNGDKIKINEHIGKIKKITLIETIIEKDNKDLVYIPNSALLNYQIYKYSKK